MEHGWKIAKKITTRRRTVWWNSLHDHQTCCCRNSFPLHARSTFSEVSKKETWTTHSFWLGFQKLTANAFCTEGRSSTTNFWPSKQLQLYCRWCKDYSNFWRIVLLSSWNSNTWSATCLSVCPALYQRVLHFQWLIPIFLRKFLPFSFWLHRYFSFSNIAGGTRTFGESCANEDTHLRLWKRTCMMHLDDKPNMLGS